MQVQIASKLDLAAIVAAVCGMLSIEHGNHIFTDAPTRTERSALPAAADCPDNDNMPYSGELPYIFGEKARIRGAAPGCGRERRRGTACRSEAA